MFLYLRIVIFGPFVAATISAVTAEVLAETKGPKIHILKYKNKTGYRKRQGHRQHYTQVKVTAINTGSKSKSK